MAREAEQAAPDRAVLFIDGNNWYHALRAGGIPSPIALSYSRILRKLVGPRTWAGTPYYIGSRQHGLTCPASRAWVTLEAELPHWSAEP